jgi:hypothetical protein
MDSDEGDAPLRQQVIEATRALGVALPCQRPIRRARVDAQTGEMTDVSIRCGTRIASQCPSCAALYRGDASAILREGLMDAAEGDVLILLTLTAPGFGATHWVAPEAPSRQSRAHDSWHRRFARRTCRCGRRHQPGDQRWQGVPLDDRTYDYSGQVRWNAMVGRLWSRTADELRRAMALEERLQYAAVAEFQRRGAVHLHVLLRLPATAPVGPYRDDAGTMRSGVVESIVAHVGTFEGARGNGTRYAWGEQVDARLVDDSSGRRQARSAGYLAKLVTYSVKDIGRDALSRKSFGADGFHVRRLEAAARALNCVEHEHEQPSEPCAACLRRRASAWGFRGHTLRRSRGWSERSLTRCRQERRSYTGGVEAPVEWLKPTGSSGVQRRYEWFDLLHSAAQVLAPDPP